MTMKLHFRVQRTFITPITESEFTTITATRRQYNKEIEDLIISFGSDLDAAVATEFRTRAKKVTLRTPQQCEGINWMVRVSTDPASPLWEHFIYVDAFWWPEEMAL